MTLLAAVRTTLAALAGAAALAGTADATTIQFTDYHATGQVLGGTFGGVDVTASAATWTRTDVDWSARAGAGVIDLYGPTDQAELNVSPWGLAMFNGPNDTSHQIDGYGADDLVLFTFSETVALTALSFGFVDRDDDFVLFAGDTMDALSAFSLTDVHGSVALFVTGRVFGVGAFDWTDDFKLTALSFDAAAVPVPAAAPLFAGAVALAGAARRRREA